MKKIFAKRFALLSVAITLCISVLAQNETIGDKAYYDVHGVVSKISYSEYNINFNQSGQSLCLDFSKTQEHGDSIDYIVPNDMVGDMVTTYDSKGRLIKHDGFEFSLNRVTYDYAGKLVYYIETNETGYHTIERFYDLEGNCIKKIVNVYEYTSDGTEWQQRYNIKYEITKKDNMGNWIERKCNGESIESRTIEYFK